MDMHHIIDLLVPKNRTVPIIGPMCHQLPVKISEIKPLPHALPVGTDKKSRAFHKASRVSDTDTASPPPELSSYASRRRELLPSEPIAQLEDSHYNAEPLSSEALTAIDAWAVPLLNTIFCANNTIAFNLKKAQYGFIFESEAERARPVNYTPEMIATLVANNHRFTIGLEHMNFIDALDGVDIQTLPEQIQYAFCEAWFGSIFEKLEQWRGARIHIDGLKWRPDISENHGYNLYFSLSRRNDKLAAKGHVSMGREALQWLAEGYAEVNNKGDFPGAGLLPFELCFEIGWMQIESEEFNRLGSNDILLPDRCSVNGQQKSVLVRLSHGSCWTGNIEHDTITITAAKEIPVGNEINKQNTAPQKRTNTAGRPPAERKIADKKNMAVGAAGTATKASGNQGQKELLTAAVVDGLHIDLVFEVGRKKVTLQELRKIKPGFTFDLATPMDRSISVVANGRTVGKGALVQIDQRIGVRLVEIIA